MSSFSSLGGNAMSATHRNNSTSSGPRVFFSYRRTDTEHETTHLAGRLREDLGSHNVFRDKDDLIAGTKWKDGLSQAIHDCDAAVFVIGPKWVGMAEDGSRRIDDPDDPVAEEVRRAVDASSTCSAVPVLVGTPTRPKNLPPDVASLFERHAITTSAHELEDSDSPAYQGVLVGVWESIRRRVPNGVLVIGDQGATAELDAVIEEMKRARLVSARRLSRFAAGACVVSARRLRKGARTWPDVVVVADTANPSPVLRARLQALDEHPEIRNVGVVGAGVAAGLVLGQIIGAGSSTAFSAASQVAPVVPQIGTGPLGTASSTWAAATTGAKAAVAATCLGATAATALAVASPFDSNDWEAPYGYVDLAFEPLSTPSTNPDGLELAEGQEWVSAEVAIENPLRDQVLTAPEEIFTLVTDGQRTPAQIDETGAIEVPASSSATGTIWWAVPEGTDVSGASIEVREEGAEPLVLPRDGNNQTVVDVAMKGATATSWCGELTFGDGYASYNLRPTPKGDPAVWTAAGNLRLSELGRAREGEIIVGFDVQATNTCVAPTSWKDVYGDVYNQLETARIGDWQPGVGHNVPRQSGTTESGQLWVSVPEDRLNVLEFDYGDDEDGGTVQADLTGVREVANLED